MNAQPASFRPEHRWRWPLLEGLLPFDKTRLGPDIMAGIILAALGIPEVMGYTKIIGTPVITGLYTLLLPVVVFALFGSSRHLVVSADSATAAMVAAGLVSLSLVANTPKYVALTSLVGILAGGLLLLARILRLGFLADFLSRSVLVGFLSGVGIQVALGELHSLLVHGSGGVGHPRWFRGICSALSWRFAGCDRDDRRQRLLSLGRTRRRDRWRGSQRLASSGPAQRGMEGCACGAAYRVLVLYRHPGSKRSHVAGLRPAIPGFVQSKRGPGGFGSRQRRSRLQQHLRRQR